MLTKVERQTKRAKNLADLLAEATVKAATMGYSMKCTYQRHEPFHRHTCANDGSTCLCECHDPED